MATSIPIRTSESQPFILLPAWVNGKGPFHFVLDTGAAMLIMTEELSRIIGIRDTEVKEALGAAGRKIQVRLGKAYSISIGNARVEDVQIGILKELPRCIGDGVIGYNFLKGYVLTIDYRGNVFTLASPGEEKSKNHPMRTRVPFRLARPDRPIILVDVVVDGRTTHQFVLDTGASQTVISPELARQAGVDNPQTDSILGAGGQVQSSIGKLKSLSMGELNVENVTVIVSDIFSALGQAAGVKLEGILGYNVLSKFTVEIDYPNGILRFG